MSSGTQLLSGTDLIKAVLDRYPHPIASVYLTMTRVRTASGRALPLIHLHESLIHYLAVVAASAYLRSELPDAQMNRELLRMLLAKTWSTGEIHGLLRDLLKAIRQADISMPYPELPGYFLDERDDGQTGDTILSQLVKLRNTLIHDGDGSDRYCEPRVTQYREILDRELAMMPWLARRPLLRVIDIEGKQVRSAQPLNGHYKPDDHSDKVRFSLDARDVGHSLLPVRQDKDSMVLRSADGKSYLPLSPLGRFVVAGNDATFFLQGSEWATQTGKPPRLKRANYVSYMDLDPLPKEDPAEPVCRLLEHHVQRLHEAVTPEVREEVKPTVVVDETPADPDFTLDSVLHEQRSHLNGFVGRRGVLAQWHRWIDSHAGGRYLLLTGEPGQGKSSLMAKLADELSERKDTLLHMVKSSASPRRFLLALISGASTLAGVRFGADAYRGDIEDLRESLIRGLAAVRKRRGRSVLVIDALDELDDEGKLATFLPAVLPEGVRVVLTCRPDVPLINTLQNRLGTHLDVEKVKPFDHDDFRELLHDRLDEPHREAILDQVSLEALFARVGPAPLFLIHFVADTIRCWKHAQEQKIPYRLDLDQVPREKEALFEQIYNYIREYKNRRASELGRERERLLLLLCVAREPLSLEELSELTGVQGAALRLGESRDRVQEMSQYVQDFGNGRYKPWHQGLADHIRRHVLGAVGERELEGVFAEWLDRYEVGQGRYGLRHRVEHLLAAGRAESAFTLLTEGEFAEMKAEAGMVFELAEDFAGASKALSGCEEGRLLRLLEEALRRDIHFLARFPEHLFQCLWNHAWWYDCSEAAGHYDLSQRTASGPLPWELPEGSLSGLLEAWRDAKDGRSPRFLWLRSLRPPSLNLGSGQLQVLRGHFDGVSSVCYSPDGARIVSGSSDKTVRVWDTATGRPLHCFKEHADTIRCVGFSPDSHRIVSGSSDATLRVWDPATGQQLLCLGDHAHWVNSVGYSPDGSRIVSGASDKTVRVWDSATGHQLLCIKGHSGWVNSVGYSPDSSRIVSGASDETVRVWDAVTGQQVLCLEGHSSGVNGVGYSPDGSRIVSSSSDKTVRVWDSITGQQLLCIEGHSDRAWSVGYSPDGSRIVSGASDRTVRVWDAVTGQHLLCLESHCNWVNSVVYAPDGIHIVSASSDDTVRIWDASQGRQLLPLVGHTSRIRSVSYGPDGNHIVSGSTDNTVRVWDVRTGQQLFRLEGHSDPVNSARYSSDGNRIVSGSTDNTVRVWDVRTGQQLFCLEGHSDPVNSVRYSPQDDRIVSGSADRTLRVWDAIVGQELLCLEGHLRGVNWVEYSPDGRRIVSGSPDRTVRVWDAATGRELDCHEGTQDITALLPDRAKQSRWMATVYESWTEVRDAFKDTVVARFPEAVRPITLHPSGRTWSGGIENYLAIFTLEGDPDA